MNKFIRPDPQANEPDDSMLFKQGMFLLLQSNKL